MKRVNPYYMSPEEYAELMGVHVVTVRRLCREGKLDGAVKVGAVWRIPRPVPLEAAGC